tara:strand:+ start:1683 stop:1934 length:252 start_codon:yes stop_codon:yes gene_type:complete
MAEMSDHQDSEHFTYDRNWEEIENMLDAAERMQNKWINRFYEAQVRGDRRTMKDCARNKKALEGVIKTLRWVLGDKDIKHPLS